jgi:dolichol-phosphate mannosyltransferase
VSIVTTTWCERENIERFVKAVRETLRGVRHEVIVVDDGSPDGTFVEATKWADVAVVKRREGQTRGLAAGLLLARFDYVVTIDVDLENPPQLIPKLIELLEKCGEFLVGYLCGCSSSLGYMFILLNYLSRVEFKYL